MSPRVVQEGRHDLIIAVRMYSAHDELPQSTVESVLDVYEEQG